jgi:hypothetical protein
VAVAGALAGCAANSAHETALSPVDVIDAPAADFAGDVPSTVEVASV